MKIEKYLEKNNYYWRVPNSYSWRVYDEFGQVIPQEKVIKDLGLHYNDILLQMFHLTKRCFYDDLDDYNSL